MKSVFFPSQLFGEEVKQKPVKNIRNNNIKPIKPTEKNVEKKFESDLPLVEKEEKVEPKKPSPETVNKLKAEEEIFNQIKDFIKSSENAFSTQKTDLVNLINESLDEKHLLLKTQMENLVENKLDKIKQFSSNQFTPEHMLLLSKAFSNQKNEVSQPTPVTPIYQHHNINVNETKKPKERGKGKYFPLPNNLWKLLVAKYPDLPDELAGRAFIKNDVKYIKVKNGYIEVNDSGVAKVLSHFRTNTLTDAPVQQ